MIYALIIKFDHFNFNKFHRWSFSPTTNINYFEKIEAFISFVQQAHVCLFQILSDLFLDVKRYVYIHWISHNSHFGDFMIETRPNCPKPEFGILCWEKRDCEKIRLCQTCEHKRNPSSYCQYYWYLSIFQRVPAHNGLFSGCRCLSSFCGKTFQKSNIPLLFNSSRNRKCITMPFLEFCVELDVSYCLSTCCIH